MSTPFLPSPMLLSLAACLTLSSCNLYDDVCRQNGHQSLKHVSATTPLGEEWNATVKPPASIQGSSARYYFTKSPTTTKVGPRSQEFSFSFGVSNERLGLKPDPSLPEDEVTLTPARKIEFQDVQHTSLPALAPKQINQAASWQAVSSVLSTGKTTKTGKIILSRGSASGTPSNVQDAGNEFIGVKLGSFKNIGSAQQFSLGRGKDVQCVSAGIYLRYHKEIQGENDNEQTRAITDVIPFSGNQPPQWRNVSSQQIADTYNKAWFDQNPLQPAAEGFTQRVRIARGEVALVLVQSDAGKDEWVQIRLLDFSGPDADGAEQATYQVQRVSYQR